MNREKFIIKINDNICALVEILQFYNKNQKIWQKILTFRYVSKIKLNEMFPFNVIEY